MKVAVVVDSAVEVPPHVSSRVFKVPIYVELGGERFKDGERTLEWLFETIKSKNVFPKTSQPTPLDFERMYRYLLMDEKFEQVVSIHLSSNLSGTYQSAVMASKKFEGKIHIVDSENAGFAPGILVCRVFQLLEEGYSLDDVLKDLEELKRKVKTIIVLKNVEFLIRGGRLTGLKALVGSVLRISPVILVKEGVLEALKNVRGMKKAFEFIINWVKRNVDYDFSVIVAHIESRENARMFMERLLESLSPKESYLLDVESLTLASHLGPGVGLFVYPSCVRLEV